jgi:hypothetical protein
MIDFDRLYTYIPIIQLEKTYNKNEIKGLHPNLSNLDINITKKDGLIISIKFSKNLIKP